MIRNPVYKLLKYHGSFRTMITSSYFIDASNRNEIFHNASLKMPFYFIYECSPCIKEQLMAKYIENPYNPIMLVTYDQ